MTPIPPSHMPPDGPPQAERQAAGRISRRRFLAGAAAVGAAAATGGALAVTRPWDQGAEPASAASVQAGGPLVLVTLYGGNDGLNTVIPYTDPAYRSLRPSLGYRPSEVLPLADGLALSPKLPGLQSLWRSGHLAIVRGVHYPNANLSHFASMAIWQTANVTDGTGSGWLGRWLDRAGDGPERAISVGATLPPVLRGDREAAAAVTGPTVTLPGDPAFQEAYAAMQTAAPDRVGLVADVAASGRDLLTVRRHLAQLPGRPSGPGRAGTATGSPPRTGGGLGGGSDIHAALATVSDLIAAGASAQVYQVSLASFDTHADERTNHERLLGDLDGAVTAFFKALEGHPRGDGVVLMTCSEFGRRPAENASGGTDHGTAAPLFVVGPRVRGGRFYGEQPSLTRLDAYGNLLFDIDFRQVYATVLEKVVGADPAAVLGGRFRTLDFV
ncbi:MAG TPA: DUF1501 domain-containing protein [Acidimicrobiales bacterium]|nr:DUF1501 domain-containing protein [Acidimicrobiales bacterium]